MTKLFMEAMFLRELTYFDQDSTIVIITDESIEFLNEWASMGAPFALVDYKKVFEDFKIEFSKSAIYFIKSFWERLKVLQWPTENINLLIASITSDQITSKLQLVLIKLIRNTICNIDEHIFEYETIKKIPCNMDDLSYFIDNKILTVNDEEIIFTITEEHMDYTKFGQFDGNYASPDYIKYDTLRKEDEQELLIFIDAKVSNVLKSIRLKYDEIRSVQDLLNLIYNHSLVNVVKPYSYGNEWILSKFDGANFLEIYKIQGPDNRSLLSAEIRKSDPLYVQIN